MIFKNENEFSLYIENLKESMGFDSIIDTIVYFHENETDQEIEDIAKLINRRLREQIEQESLQNNLLKYKQNSSDINLDDFE